jgi:hypothetical protein
MIENSLRQSSLQWGIVSYPLPWLAGTTKGEYIDEFHSRIVVTGERSMVLSRTPTKSGGGYSPSPKVRYIDSSFLHATLAGAAPPSAGAQMPVKFLRESMRSAE